MIFFCGVITTLPFFEGTICNKEKRLEYVNNNTEFIYKEVVDRRYISRNQFIDIRTVQCFNGKDNFTTKSSDIFLIKGNNWYIKEFGKFELYLGEESFHKDSIIIHLDLKDTKESLYGKAKDTIPIYPYSQTYKPVQSIKINEKKTIYIYSYESHVFESESRTGLYVFFDPEIGIVKRWGWDEDSYLKGYKYLDEDKLKNFLERK